jgi:hypothetical protein
MIALNKPLDVDREFETPQELARALADLLELHPHVLAPTSNTATARRLDGGCGEFYDPRAVRYCAVGAIRRVAFGEMDFWPSESEERERRLRCVAVADGLIVAMNRTIRLTRCGLGTWFERRKPDANLFARYLRRTADRLDKLDAERNAVLGMSFSFGEELVARLD